MPETENKTTKSKTVSDVVTLPTLVEQISQENKMPKSAVESVVMRLLELVRENLINGKKVRLSTLLGTLAMRVRKESTGRNPRTGEMIKVPERMMPYLRPSKDFKDNCKQERS